jgi:hypothetical protein
MQQRGLLPTLICVMIMLAGVRTYCQDRHIPYRNQLKASPLRFIDLTAPGIDISYERKFGNKSLQLSATWMKEFVNTTPFWNLEGYRIALEQKFFTDKPGWFNPYLSIEPAYMQAKYTYSATFSTSMAPFTLYTDTFDVSRKTYSLHFKYGIQFIMDRFVIDVAAGLGLRYRDIRRSRLDNPNGLEERPIHPNIYYAVTREQKAFIPVFPINIRFGFCF